MSDKHVLRYGFATEQEISSIGRPAVGRVSSDLDKASALAVQDDELLGAAHLYGSYGTSGWFRLFPHDKINSATDVTEEVLSAFAIASSSPVFREFWKVGFIPKIAVDDVLTFVLPTWPNFSLYGEAIRCLLAVNRGDNLQNVWWGRAPTEFRQELVSSVQKGKKIEILTSDTSKFAPVKDDADIYIVTGSRPRHLAILGDNKVILTPVSNPLTLVIGDGCRIHNWSPHLIVRLRDENTSLTYVVNYDDNAKTDVLSSPSESPHASRQQREGHQFLIGIGDRTFLPCHRNIAL